MTRAPDDLGPPEPDDVWGDLADDASRRPSLARPAPTSRRPPGRSAGRARRPATDAVVATSGLGALARGPARSAPASASSREPADRPRRTATAEIADLLADLTVAGARTLAFTRSRRGAESVAATTRAHLLGDRPVAGARRVRRTAAATCPRSGARWSTRSGRAPCARSRRRTPSSWASTSPGLDAVLIAGWPGTRVSLWQQAGRAGRAGADGLVVLVAREDPLDTFLVHHPEAIFDTPVEATVFDTTNPYVLAPHLCAAAAELPAALRGARPVRSAHRRAARRARRARRPAPAAVRLVLDPQRAGQPPDRPARLRRRPGPRRRVRHRPAARHGRRRVRRLDRARRCRLRAPGRDVRRRRAAPRGRRRPGHPARRRLRHLGPLGRPRPRSSPSTHEVPWGPVTWGFGAVDVTTQVLGYQRKRIPDLQVLGTEELDLPARTLRTTAVWWTAPAAVLEAAGVDARGRARAPCTPPSTRRSASSRCWRRATGGTSAACRPRCTSTPSTATVFVHDAYPGGAGFAERGFALGRDLAARDPRRDRRLPLRRPAAPRASSRPSAATRTTRWTRPPRSACSTRSSPTRPRLTRADVARPASEAVRSARRRRPGTRLRRRDADAGARTTTRTRSTPPPSSVAADAAGRRCGGRPRRRVAHGSPAPPGSSRGAPASAAEVRRRLRPPRARAAPRPAAPSSAATTSDDRARAPSSSTVPDPVVARVGLLIGLAPAARSRLRPAPPTSSTRAQRDRPATDPTASDTVDASPTRPTRDDARPPRPRRPRVAPSRRPSRPSSPRAAARAPARAPSAHRVCATAADDDREQRDQHEHHRGQPDRELGGDARPAVPPRRVERVTATAPDG